MKARVNIPKSMLILKALKELVWKAARWNNGEQLHKEKSVCVIYVPSNDFYFLVFEIKRLEKNMYCTVTVAHNLLFIMHLNHF